MLKYWYVYLTLLILWIVSSILIYHLGYRDGNNDVIKMAKGRCEQHQKYAPRIVVNVLNDIIDFVNSKYLEFFWEKKKSGDD